LASAARYARTRIISNGDFEEHWRFHLEREHERLYPDIEQGQYTLSA